MSGSRFFAADHTARVADVIVEQMAALADGLWQGVGVRVPRHG